jgi:sigma-B regulation protein RsbU (phosphoserine phosphatase)
MIRPKSLQQRFTIFMLLPVALLLLTMGSIGFFYARNSLLEQWSEASMLKLERAAHQVDMRLNRPKVWLNMYYDTSGKVNADPVRAEIIRQLSEMEGVVSVKFDAYERAADPSSRFAPPDKEKRRPQRHHMGAISGGIMFHKARMLEITPPRYDSLFKNQTVSIISEFKNTLGKPTGRLEVVLRFDYLMDSVLSTGWWQSHKAFLVDDSGKVLASTASGIRKQLGEEGNLLELRIMEAIRENLYGTVMGKGHPAVEVGGFYRLQEAPWNLVMFAPGDEILLPIIRFRNYYLLTGLAFILFILVLVRLVTGRTVSAIKKVTQAARKVAKGEYKTHITSKTTDEVGELIRDFNSMAVQLEERMQMKRDLGLAKEVQQNLLPRTNPAVPGLDIAGKSIYCDETGGDYYDFFTGTVPESAKIRVVVGDVSGHGVSSALLMATTRAILRQHSSADGHLGRTISTVNRQIAEDVEDSGSFVTLFYIEIDKDEQKAEWIRAGHDAAFIFDPHTGTFTEFSGRGLPLGVLDTAEYHETHQAISPGQMIIIGTDGIWETRNSEGELFGKKSFKDIIRNNSHLSAEHLIDTVIEKLHEFRLPEKQEDDITLVIIKVEERP